CLGQLAIDRQVADTLAGRPIDLAQHNQRAGLAAPALPRDHLDDVAEIRHCRRPSLDLAFTPFRRGYCSIYVNCNSLFIDVLWVYGYYRASWCSKPHIASVVSKLNICLTLLTSDLRWW